MKLAPATTEGIQQVAAAIREGRVAAYPTETVYGLGADPFNEEAIQRLFEAKGRDPSNPILLIAADEKQLASVVAGMSPAAQAYARAFWPGPLSMLLRKSPRVPARLTGGGDTLCVRVTSCPLARDLCRAVGGPITSTSANRAGAPPARCATEVDLPGVEICLDGGVLPPSEPSTVLDPETGAVLRPGAISEEALHAVRRMSL